MKRSQFEITAKVLLIAGLILGVFCLFLEDHTSKIILLVLLVLNEAAGLQAAFMGHKDRQESELRIAKEKQLATQAQLEKKKQELLALQSQINPHFFYNTLDTFRGSAIENGNYELSRMIAALSGMFKYSVNYSDEMVTLNQEMNYLKKYIQIQQMRFPDRFSYVEDIRCDGGLLLSQPCPRFVLQPIVENAIRHGLEDVSKGGRIRLTMDMTEREILMTVDDNGKGMNSETLQKMNERLAQPETAVSQPKGDGGVGLYNVNARIKMFCGEEWGLHVESTEGEGTQVSIRLPREDAPNA